MTTMGDEPLFLDTNIFVYAAVETAPLHEAASNVIRCHKTAGTLGWTSRQVLREFMCVMTRPQSFSPLPPVAMLVDQIN